MVIKQITKGKNMTQLKTANLKVENMISSKGNKIANQFVIEECLHYSGSGSYTVIRKTFQSYNSIIARISTDPMGPNFIELDSKYWNYSKTTSKYRSLFLGESTKQTEAKIKSGEYVLTDLNTTKLKEVA
jgi:hypothetical protein